ncbi:MAG: DegV family protein [Clostridia bacterium]|nr:DegV family protein [Clostridia bacterium]MDY5264405.1 DegV family protein [Eubacteriales bacterium]
MTDFIISTDACANVPNFIKEKYDVPVVPMPFSLNEPIGEKDALLLGIVKKTEYKRFDYRSDNCGMTMSEFYDKLQNGAIPLTSQANAHDTAEFLEPYLKEGKDVLHISFSSGMSGTYNSACIAQKELQEKYPDRKIIVVDSLSGAGGQGLMLIDAFKQKEQGKSIEETAKYLEEEKLRYHHYFTVGDIKFIARSGRISSFQEIIGTLLGITIILGIDSEGKVYPAAKVRGKKKVARKMLELFEDNKDGQDNPTIIMSHGNCLDEIKELGEELQSENSEVKNIDYDYVNMLVGSNSGPGSLALFFKGEKRTFVQNK